MPNVQCLGYRASGLGFEGFTPFSVQSLQVSGLRVQGGGPVECRVLALGFLGLGFRLSGGFGPA